MTTLQITTRPAGPQTIVELVGILNLATGPEFTARLGELLRDGHRHLILDAAQLHAADRSAAQILTCALARAQAAGARLVLARPGPELAALLHSGADATRLMVYASLTEAVRTPAAVAG
jgi:anti-anti-sigma regulatory factor